MKRRRVDENFFKIIEEYEELQLSTPEMVPMDKELLKGVMLIKKKRFFYE